MGTDLAAMRKAADDVDGVWTSATGSLAMLPCRWTWLIDWKVTPFVETPADCWLSSASLRRRGLCLPNHSSWLVRILKRPPRCSFVTQGRAFPSRWQRTREFCLKHAALPPTLSSSYGMRARRNSRAHTGSRIIRNMRRRRKAEKCAEGARKIERLPGGEDHRGPSWRDAQRTSWRVVVRESNSPKGGRRIREGRIARLYWRFDVAARSIDQAEQAGWLAGRRNAGQKRHRK